VPPVSQLDHLLSAAETAELLGYSVATIKRRAKDGTLPVAMKLPGATGAYLFDRNEVLNAEGVTA
jgi:predicted DNA-binding transcriptional regulator AlpA